MVLILYHDRDSKTKWLSNFGDMSQFKIQKKFTMNVPQYK